jgi:hypothetical protein
MLSSDHTNIPLSETEILNIRNNLKNYDYEVLTKLENIILAIRTDRDHPDLMEDLENVYHQLEQKDTFDLTHVCLIGNENVINVKPEIITALMNRRSEDDNVLVSELRSKLNRDFESHVFKDERDPSSVLRFVVRVPYEEISTDPSLMFNIFSNVSDEIEGDILYVIADNNFIRLTRRSATAIFRTGDRMPPVSHPDPVEASEPEVLAPEPGLEPLEPVVPEMPPVFEPPKMEPSDKFITGPSLINPPSIGEGGGDKFDFQAEFGAFLADREIKRSGEILEPKFDFDETETPPAAPEPFSDFREPEPPIEKPQEIFEEEIKSEPSEEIDEPPATEPQESPFVESESPDIPEILPTPEPKPEEPPSFEIPDLPEPSAPESLPELDFEAEPEETPVDETPVDELTELPETFSAEPEPEHETVEDLPSLDLPDAPEPEDEDSEDNILPEIQPAELPDMEDDKDEGFPEPVEEIKTLVPKPSLKLRVKAPEVRRTEDIIEPDEPDVEEEDKPTPEELDINNILSDEMNDMDDLKPSSTEFNIETIPEPEPEPIPEPEAGGPEPEMAEPEIHDQDLKTMIPDPEPEPEPDESGGFEQPRSEGIIGTIEDALGETGFEIVRETSIDGVDVIASASDGKYKRVFVKYVDECTMDTVNEMEKLIGFNFADAGLVIAPEIPELITAFSLPEKVHLFSLDDFTVECKDRTLLTS